MSMRISSGGTANSSTIRCYPLIGYGYTTDGSYRWNWDKSFILVFNLRCPIINTQGVYYIQMKGATTIGSAGTYDIGLKVANLALYGESYGSGGLSTLDLSTSLTDSVMSQIEIVYTAGSNIKWYVNGVLKGTQSTANLIPNGNSTTNTELCFSIQNGAAAADYVMQTSLIRLGVAQ
jgi:hypothetical protein